MSVPFDSLGDGQKGRLVYQVIGKDGPIFNPQNIRYLGPEDSGFPSVPTGNVLLGMASNLALGISGLNLLATVANVALSAVILKDVRSLSRQLEDSTQRVLSGLAVIEDKLKKVDVKVQELHLREVLKHLERTCVIGDTIYFTEIGKIEPDVRHFVEAVEGFEFGEGAAFELSYDVREKLYSLCSLLRSTRTVIAVNHNQKVMGDPFRTLQMDIVGDYVQENRLSLNDQLVDDGLQIYASCSGFPNKPSNVIENIRSYWSREHNGQPYWGKQLFKGLVRKIVENAKPDKQLDAAWLWNTDMGLVWRLHKELRALGDYSAEFPHWKRIESVPLGTDKILIDCTWDKKLMEATA